MDIINHEVKIFQEMADNMMDTANEDPITDQDPSAGTNRGDTPPGVDITTNEQGMDTSTQNHTEANPESAHDDQRDAEDPAVHVSTSGPGNTHSNGGGTRSETLIVSAPTATIQRMEDVDTIQEQPGSTDITLEEDDMESVVEIPRRLNVVPVKDQVMDKQRRTAIIYLQQNSTVLDPTFMTIVQQVAMNMLPTEDLMMDLRLSQGAGSNAHTLIIRMTRKDAITEYTSKTVYNQHVSNTMEPQNRLKRALPMRTLIETTDILDQNMLRPIWIHVYCVTGSRGISSRLADTVMELDMAIQDEDELIRVMRLPLKELGDLGIQFSSKTLIQDRGYFNCENEAWKGFGRQGEYGRVSPYEISLNEYIGAIAILNANHINASPMRTDFYTDKRQSLHFIPGSNRWLAAVILLERATIFTGASTINQALGLAARYEETKDMLVSAILTRIQTKPEECGEGWLTKALHIDDVLVRRMLQKIGLSKLSYPRPSDQFLTECRQDPAILNLVRYVRGRGYEPTLTLRVDQEQRDAPVQFRQRHEWTAPRNSLDYYLQNSATAIHHDGAAQ